MQKEGQISVEYLIVVAFVVFIVIIVLGAALYYTLTSQDQIKINQLTTFANKLTGSMESVYYSGEPSKVTITAYLPEGVQGFELVGNELVFDIVTSTGVARLAFTSKVPVDPGIDFTINSGLKRLVITAGADRVYVAQN